jgi:CopG family nickel-responsive transcriptional regulator
MDWRNDGRFAGSCIGGTAFGRDSLRLQCHHAGIFHSDMSGSTMRRLTISVDDELADAFDRLVEKKHYLNRSEAFRDLVRKELGESEISAGKVKWCVATLSYIYDHHERQLANRITQLQHDHHDVAVAAQHVHLDHDNCLETVILRGRIAEVRACADAIISQTGVRHGNVHIVPVDIKSTPYVQVGHKHVHPHS